MRFPRFAATVLILGSMVWLAARYDGVADAFAWRGQKSDYYNLLVHGFLHGHLSLDAPVDPRLLSPDPAIRAQAPFLLDASLYHGKYYLYFGIVPAVLLFLPYRLLTGQDLPENAAVLFLVALGFLGYLQIYRMARRRYFPDLGPWLNAIAVLLLAFGACTPILLIDGGFYEVAVAGGYSCLAFTWLGLWQAWHAATDSPRWLALASLAAGLAVGCRPNSIFALVAVAAVAILLARRAVPTAGRMPLWPWAVAAVLPAGLIGLAIMAYNYGRFQNPLEFGFHYQLSELVRGHSPLARFSFFWPNLQWYYLRPPVLSPYFPYVFPLNAENRPPDYYGYEAIYGQLAVSSLALVTGTGLFLRRRPAPPRSLTIFLILLGATFVALFLGMAFFGFRANRYVPDFQATLVLLLALAGGYAAAAPSADRLPSRIGRTAWCALALGAVLTNVLGGMQWADHFQKLRPGTFRVLARWGEYPAHWLTRASLLRYGPVRFKVVFPSATPNGMGPLLVTGTPNLTDTLYAIRTAPGTIAFLLVHAGDGGLRSETLPLAPGEHELEVDMGSLYPPRIDSYFDRWDPTDIEKLKSFGRVRFDGQEVIHGQMRFYDSPPAWVEFGRDPAGSDPDFDGKISSVRRLPARDPHRFAEIAESGVWRLEIELPSRAATERSPLLASGIAGHGNLLLLRRLPGERVAFALDQWNGGITTSSPIALGAGSPHRLEIFVGPQVARQPLPAAWKLDAAEAQAQASVLRIWLDGFPVWTTAVTVNQDSYDFVSVGGNAQGFSTAPAFFDGAIKSFPYSATEMQAFITRNLRAAPAR